ncbi:MAG TPA: hypothetical protein VH593_05265 [Ktedonobacteraceae bacterium]
MNTTNTLQDPLSSFEGGPLHASLYYHNNYRLVLSRLDGKGGKPTLRKKQQLSTRGTPSS